MALDVGERNIGVAVSDALRITAQGRLTLTRTGWESDIRQLRRLVEENEIDTIVIGKPLHMSGQESAQSQRMKRFARKVSKTLSLPVILWDERLTSFEAEQQLEAAGLSWRERKKHVDKVAAMLILQEYLDSRPQ